MQQKNQEFFKSSRIFLKKTMTIIGKCVGREFAITFLGNPSASSEIAALKSNWTNKNRLKSIKITKTFFCEIVNETGNWGRFSHF